MLTKGILGTLLLAGIFAFFISCAESGQKEKQPNILFVFADDWRYYASIYDGIEGGGTIHSVIDTPNFDELAENGGYFIHTLSSKNYPHILTLSHVDPLDP